MSWLPVGVAYLAAVLQLAIVEIETDAGEAAVAAAGPDDPRVRCRPRATAGRLRTTSPPRRSRCGAATSPTPAARSTAAGPASGRPRSGCSSPGWRRWSPRSTRPPPPRPASIASWRRWPPRASGRPRSSPRRPISCAPRATPMTAGSRRVAEASLATARAFQRRLEGDDDPSRLASCRARLGRARGAL